MRDRLHSLWSGKKKSKGGASEYYAAEDDMEDQKNGRKRRIFSRPVYFSYLLTVLLFLAVLFTCDSPNLKFNNERVGKLTGDWRVAWENNNRPVQSEKASLPYKRKIPAGEKVVYSIILPESTTKTGLMYNSIMFRAFHEYVRVRLDGELLYEFGYDQSMLFSDAPNNGWLIVRLPGNSAGKILSIEKTGYYDDYAGTLHDVFLGTKNALVFYVLNSCLPVLYVNLCIILMSLGILIVSFLFKKKYMVYQLRYLSAFSMTTSIWLILETGGYQLFAGRPVIIGNVVFLVFSLIPLVFIRFLLTFECFENSRYMKYLLYVSFGSFLLIHLMQLFGVMNYLESVFLTHIMVVLAILGIIGKFIRMRMKKEKTKSRHLFVSCFVFALFAFIDLIRFYTKNPAQPTLFSQIGFFFYFIILCCFAVHRIVKDMEENRNRIFFQQMAYTDILTGLPNRNAFEREMKYYGREKSLRPAIMVIDLNGLKHINDSFGHSRGDAAIVEVGHSLREYFADRGHVFRVGGDEFCAIFQDGIPKAYSRTVQAFKEQLMEKSGALGFPLTVAVGTASTGPSVDLPEAFNEADACMYEDKKKCKERGPRSLSKD